MPLTGHNLRLLPFAERAHATAYPIPSYRAPQARRRTEGFKVAVSVGQRRRARRSNAAEHEHCAGSSFGSSKSRSTDCALFLTACFTLLGGGRRRHGRTTMVLSDVVEWNGLVARLASWGWVGEWLSRSTTPCTDNVTTYCDCYLDKFAISSCGCGRLHMARGGTQEFAPITSR